MAEAGHLEADVERCVARCNNDRGELLSVLRGVQGELGCLPREALTAVAAALGLPRAHVEATASFYHLLHGEPHGAYEILFSDNIIDELAGRRELMQYLCEQLWVQPGKLSEDGLVWIATTSDIGLADQPPAALVNGRPLPALDKSRLDLVTELVRERWPLAEWLAMLFAVAYNVRRAGPLLGAPFGPGTALARAAALGAEAAHKMCGPTGIGALYGKTELLEAMPPFLGGGDMIKEVKLRSFRPNTLPHKIETGTPAIAEAVGFGAAVDYLSALGMDTVAAHEHEITEYALELLEEVPGVKVFGPASENKGGVAAFTLEGVHPHDVAQILDRDGIAVRAGHHCAQPLHEKFGIPATSRASFYLYNTKEEVDLLVNGIYKVKEMFG